MDFNDFPDFLVTAVTSYLSKESRALLAVAVTAPSASWRCGGGRRSKPSAKGLSILTGAPLLPDVVCRTSQGDKRDDVDDEVLPIIRLMKDAVLGAERLKNEWESFDFGDLQLATGKRYAPFGGSLDDDDLRAVLLCIDAANIVKSLKLTRCHNITGRGLEPLRESKIIQLIDLSLVGVHDDQRVYSKLKVKEVVPILKSIVINKSGGAPLRHVHLPFQWRQEKKEELTYFILAYNGSLHLSPPPKCCNHDHPEIECTENSATSLEVRGWDYGIQINKCYKCLDEFCSDCTDGDWDLGCFYCGMCEKVICNRCSGYYHLWCEFCCATICEPCVDMGKAVICNDCGEVQSCISCEGVRYSEKHDCYLCAECLEDRER